METISVRISAELKNQLQSKARQNNSSLSAYVASILLREINGNEDPSIRAYLHLFGDQINKLTISNNRVNENMVDLTSVVLEAITVDGGGNDE